MAWRVRDLVYSRIVGSAARKAVLVYCADRADDTGAGVWSSKSRIAEETELSRRAVQNTIKDFVSEGLLIEIGKRGMSRGHTIEYRLDVDAIKALPMSNHAKNDMRQPEDMTPEGMDESPRGVNVVHPSASDGVNHVHPLPVDKPPEGVNGVHPLPVDKSDGVNRVHVWGAPGAPHGVQPVHTNLPLTFHEKKEARASEKLSTDTTPSQLAPEGRADVSLEYRKRTAIRLWLDGIFLIDQACVTPERLRAMVAEGRCTTDEAEQALRRVGFERGLAEDSPAPELRSHG